MFQQFSTIYICVILQFLNFNDFFSFGQVHINNNNIISNNNYIIKQPPVYFYIFMHFGGIFFYDSDFYREEIFWLMLKTGFEIGDFFRVIQCSYIEPFFQNIIGILVKIIYVTFFTLYNFS